MGLCFAFEKIMQDGFGQGETETRWCRAGTPVLITQESG